MLGGKSFTGSILFLFGGRHFVHMSCEDCVTMQEAFIIGPSCMMMTPILCSIRYYCKISFPHASSHILPASSYTTYVSHGITSIYYLSIEDFSSVSFLYTWKSHISQTLSPLSLSLLFSFLETFYYFYYRSGRNCEKFLAASRLCETLKLDVSERLEELWTNVCRHGKVSFYRRLLRTTKCVGGKG